MQLEPTRPTAKAPGDIRRAASSGRDRMIPLLTDDRRQPQHSRSSAQRGCQAGARFNGPALDPVVLAALTAALGAARGAVDEKQPGRTLRDLAVELGAPTSLASLGAERDALPGIAADAAASPYSNPRDASDNDIAALLDRAWAGDDPRS